MQNIQTDWGCTYIGKQVQEEKVQNIQTDWGCTYIGEYLKEGTAVPEESPRVLPMHEQLD